MSDLEHDREELHEIARSDKNSIHELNIQLAESSLSNKNLKAQVTRYNHCSRNQIILNYLNESIPLSIFIKIKESKTLKILYYRC